MGIFSKIWRGVKNVISAPFKLIKNIVKAAISVVSSVIKFATQAFMGMLGGAPDLSSNEAATNQAQGIQLQRSGSIASVPVVYGYRKVGAITPFIETGSDNNKYLWVSYVFSEGPIEGLYKLYLNDIDVDTGNTGVSAIAKLNNGETVDITWSKFNGRVKMRFFPGVYHTDPESSTVGSTVLADVFNGAPSFTPRMIYNGLATLFVRFEYFAIKTQEDADANPWDGSVPRMTAEILGRKVQRLYTNTGSATTPTFTKINSTQTNSWYSPGNESYSTNPAEILLDYLRNKRYGKGLENTEIDWDSWYATANKCNQYVNFTPTTRGSILQLHPVIETEQSIFNNVKMLLQQFRAYMPYTQGKYKLKIEDAGHPTDITSGSAIISATFNNNNIVGSVSYTGINRSSKYNQVIVTYVDPTATGKFTNQTVVYPETEAERQVYIAQDGNREYKLEITMPGITNYAIAKDMARLLFNKSRYQETCTVTVTSQAFELELGDNIYIQSKVLNFSTTPWRVVSIKYNEDYSFELGCVRNPDFIYPYVTVGEADVVSATYLPKGAQIYYPPNVDTTPHIGLRPPSKVRLPGNSASSDNPLTNPDPSNNPVENNNTPIAPPTLPNLIDTINVTGQKTVYIAGQAYVVLIWRQPDVPMFRSVLLTVTGLYGPAATSPTLYFEYIVNPREGDIVEFQIGPLAPNSVYRVVSRIKYTTLEQSTATNTFDLSVDAAVATTPATTTTTTTPTTTPPSTAVTPPTTTPVYTAPPTTPPAPAVRDNYCSSLVGEITAANYAADPRVVTWTLTLNANNADVVGFNYYIKPTTDTFWRTFPGRNSGGVAFNSSIPCLLTLELTNVGRATAFDLIIRVAYKDGSESTKQQRLSFNVTSPGGVYPYNFFSGINATAILENTSAYTPTLAPPGFVGTAADIRMGVVSTQYKLTNGILFNLNPPATADRSYWYGQTIRYRPFTPGTNPTFTSILDKTVTPIVDGTIPVIISPIVYNQKYEIVITPYVSVGGTKRDADNSWYGVGFVNNSTTSTLFPPDSNWNFNFNWQNVLTSTALQTINTAFAPPVMADATVQLSQFDTYNVNGNFSSVSVDNGSSFVLQSYHKLAYSGVGITNYKGVRIYRRQISPPSGGVLETTGGVYAKYYGWGRWEYIDSTATSLTLRGPTVAAEFNPYYEVAGRSGNTNLLNYGYQGAYNGNLANNNKKQIQPANAGNQQFLIVVQFTDDSFSTKGLLINVARNVSSSPNPYNHLKPNLPQTVSLSTYNSYTGGYSRNLSEARSVLANTGIGFAYNQPLTTAGTEASITKFVTYPTTDSTVGGSITPGIQ